MCCFTFLSCFAKRILLAIIQMCLNQTAHAANWQIMQIILLIKENQMKYSKNKSQYENNGLLFKKLSVKMKFIIEF